METTSEGAMDRNEQVNQPSFGTVGNKRVLIRSANLDPPSSPSASSLDSSLKKNTAFIKRLKTGLHAPENVQIIVKETRSLSLDKYLSEIASAANEGLMKCKNANEIWGAVEAISALHQRFSSSFTGPFIQQFLTGLSLPSKQYLSSLTAENRDREESSRIIRQRSLLRCLAEFDLVGLVLSSGKQVVQATEEGEVTFGVLKDLLTANKDALTVPLPLATSFAKQFLLLYFPAPSDNGPTPSEAILASQNPTTDNTIVKSSLKEKFKKLLCQYFDVLSRKAVKDHVKLQELEKKNEEVAIRSGQIFEDRVQSFEKLSRDQEKLWSGVLNLAEILSLSPPTLPAVSSSTLQPGAITGTGISSNFGSGGSQLGVWTDDEEKKFYEDLIDLKNEVPAMLLGLEAVPKKAVEENEEQKSPSATLEEEMQKLAMKDLLLNSNSTEEVSTTSAPEPDQTQGAADSLAGDLSQPNTSEALPSGPAARLTALFTRLDEAHNIESVDRITVEFAYLNSKAARNRLIKHLGGVSRSRTDLIPYFSRMAATLSKYMPDISSGLFSIVEDEFRYFQRKKTAATPDLYATRSKNIRYIAELTKFNLVPSHSILHIIKVLVDDLSNVNIENLCNLLEGCGRWVLKNPRTGEKMIQLLDQMKRKKTSQNLDSRQVMMLENAYYQCDPEDRPVIVPKERTPMELFIRYQLYDCLSKKSLDKVIKTLRKLPWNDPEVVKLLKNILTKVWKIKYGNIYLFAIIAYDLSKYHPSFTVSVADQVLENIRFHTETNIFKLNQQRIASVKYLGELYNYRVIDSRVIFDTLWSFVTFGHLEGRPWPDVVSPLDTPDDFFRVRLVCTLLHTCGHCFDRGSLKRRLNNFLKFFLMYLRCKETPPMDIEFLLQDTFEELRPKLNIYIGYEEAAKAVEEMFTLTSNEGDKEDGKAEEDDTRDEGEVMGRKDGDDANESDSDNDTVTNEVKQTEIAEEEQELPRNVISTITAEEEEEFARELAKMIAETGGSQSSHAPTESGILGGRKLERNPMNGNLFSDQGLPIIKTSLKPSASIKDSNNEVNGMTFTLLTKKGNKQQLKTMQIPSDASIAVHTRTQQKNSQVEHQQLKKLVLDYEQREEANERKSMQAELAKKGINLKFVNG